MIQMRKFTSLVLLAAGLLFFAFSFSHAALTRRAPATILYSFAGGADAKSPEGDLIQDDEGALYGVSADGGGSTACFSGCGTVYTFAAGQESVLYAFAGGTDGSVPAEGLLRDSEGNLYGATAQGGAGGFGTIFKLSLEGVKTILHAFLGGTGDGASPHGDLIADSDGNLYGTTLSGGSGACTGGCGTVFKLASDGQETILHNFGGGAAGDGAYPSSGLIADGNGNFYGPTGHGGPLVARCGNFGCGTIFQITPAGDESVYFAFKDPDKGAVPSGRLAMDGAGNLFGTTGAGGGSFHANDGFGTVFKVTPTRQETVLYAFRARRDGYGPSGVILDSDGNLYGNSFFGGDNFHGLVYKVTPDGGFHQVALFTDPSTEGFGPVGRLLLDSNGILYGTNSRGGAAGDNGTLFSVRK